MLQWSAEILALELKYTWKISRNASDRKINLVVEVKDEFHSGKGEAAPNIRYDETAEDLINQFNRFLKSGVEDISSVPMLIDRMEEFHLSYALRFAIESAWHHFQASAKMMTTSELFGFPPLVPVPTVYTIPIMDIAAMKPFFLENRLSRFHFIKLKVNTEAAYESVRYLSSICQQRLMIDANEAFQDVDSCIYFLEKIKKLPVEFVEQPLPSTMTEEQVYLKKYSPFPLFADESITHDADFPFLKKRFDGINVKLMKAGGYLTAMTILKEARKQGMKTMIGCMVESTLGISSALNLQSLANYLDLDSFLFIRDEPYHLVAEDAGMLVSAKR